MERRKPLKPGKPLQRRTPMPRRAREAKTRMERTTARQVARRDTGPTQAEKRIVAERAGYSCEVCGRLLHSGEEWLWLHSWHHRQPRGKGGTSRPVNTPVHLLFLCGMDNRTGCHGLIETQRTLAEAHGWLVRHGFDPAEIPVHLHDDRIVYLTPDGDYAEGTP